MICSLQELGIEQKLVAKEFTDGIYIFPAGVETGSSAVEALQLHDTVLELDLTPNRADCLSMLGTAYEVASLLDRKVTHPNTQVEEHEEKTESPVSVSVENEEDAPYYNARVISNIKIKPSPVWMQNRLIAAGIRPINNAVDITNYILIEYGQPLHAFDLDRFGSREIVVRRAEMNEKMVTLDETERELSPEYLVITNGTEPTALAGVMGGSFSEVQEDTTTILLETAVFDPALVRKASKDMGLRSESSVRLKKELIIYGQMKQLTERQPYLWNLLVEKSRKAGQYMIPETVLRGLFNEDRKASYYARPSSEHGRNCSGL